MTDAYRCPDCGWPTADAEAMVEHMSDVHDNDTFSLADTIDHTDDADDDTEISDILI